MRTTLLILLGLLLTRGLADDGKPAAPKFTPEQVAFYEKQVLPILKENCYKCHTGKKLRGGLSLESRAAMMKGGDLGPVLVPGKFDTSPFVRAVRFSEGLEMPPAGKLPQAKIDVLVKWAEMGLPFTPGKEVVVKGPEHGKMKVTDADRDWWAYRPLKRPAVPAVKDAAWGCSPIDVFVRAKQEAAGLRPVGEADRLALARRAYYGLTGLPPTPEQIDAFVNDKRPDAYERLVDSLLSSSGYGERWGRHWLDLVRYAESHGYERDSAKPFAWRYRDWVVDAFNANMRYDRFILEQLAGDEVPGADARTLTATGYYRLGIWDDEPADRLQAKYDVLDGVVSTTSSVFLGMSVGCARCHDHKKDPIPQRDYYKLLAVFRDVTDMNRENLRRVRTADDEKHRLALIKERQAEEGRTYSHIYAQEQKFLKLLKEKGLAGDVGAADMTDLTYRFYRDAWHELPDFAAITPVQSGKVAGGRFSLAPAPTTETMALVFEGKLNVPKDGEYTFEAEFSDGSRLIVGGKRVIDRPKTGRGKATGTAKLGTGLVPIRLEYFNTTTKAELNVFWSGPGVERRALSDEGGGTPLVRDSRAAGVQWKYTTVRPDAGWMRPGFDDAKWKKGPGGFGTRGTPGAAVRTVWNGQNIWLRKTFTIDKLPAALSLDLHHDDHVQVYLNGQRVLSRRGYLVAYQRFPLGPDALKALKVGENVLAVHCEQTFGGQYIDAGLVGDARADVPALLRQHGAKLLGADEMSELARLAINLARLRKLPPTDAGLQVMCVTESGRATTNVLIRGNPHAPGDAVTAGVPEVLGEKTFEASKEGTSGRRRQLAEWMVNGGARVTARAMVNRVWQYHFGRGIAPTTNDLGKLGEPPTHPELLDWLASELIDSGWDLKHLHRVIMRSATYRLSSKGQPEALAKDASNNLLWRCTVRRLHAEEVRDSILAASGDLNRRMAGPPIYPTIPPAVLAGQSVPGAGWGKSPPEEQARRSVYVHVKRSLLVPILETHDSADTDSSCAVRYTTTVPTQALGMLNGEFTNEQALRLADRLRAEAKDVPAQVRRAVRLTTGREPGEEEVKRDVAFIERLMKEDELDARRALAAYCLLALNTNEFVYLD